MSLNTPDYFSRHRRIPKEQRHKRRSFTLAERNSFGEICAICGSDYKPALDHIIPLAAGGTNERDNLQMLCGPCNYRKGSTRTNEDMKAWYAANKSDIDAYRRWLEVHRFCNPYDCNRYGGRK